MVATVQDVLKVNIVLVGVGLLRLSDEAMKFRDAVGSEMTPSETGMLAGFPLANAEPGIAVSLNKDRIRLDLSPAQSMITRDYPLRDELDRLADVIRLAISVTDTSNQQPTGFGYNIELTFDQTTGGPASQYLADRLFRNDLTTSLGWQPQGGTARLFFRDQESSWSLTLEPRFLYEGSGRVFVSANRHFDEPPLPDADKIHQSLEALWDQAHQFIQQLDGSVQ